jgi:hypothetical protein
VIQIDNCGPSAALFLRAAAMGEFSNEAVFCAALIGAVFFNTGSLAHAEDPVGKHHKHHKVQEWLSLLSDADRAKLRAAKEQAKKILPSKRQISGAKTQRLSIANYSTKKCSRPIRPSNRYSTRSPS